MPASMYPTALYTHGRLASDQELTLDEWNQIGKEVEAIESTLNWVFGNPALFPGVSQAPVPWKLSVQELSWGVGTIRGRLVDYGGAGNMQVRANASVVDLLDDATKAGWAIRIGATLTVDTFSVFRAPATGGTATWRELLQVDSAGSITAPGTTAGGSDQAVMRLGTRTQKLRVYALPGLDWGGLTLNNAYDGATWTRDDAAKPAWRTVMRTDLDQFTVEHVTAAGGSTLPVTVDAQWYCHCC